MSKYLIMLSLLAFLVGPAWTQDEEAAAGPAEAEETDAGRAPSEELTGTTEDEDEIDDSDLDEQTYEEDGDDFVPTEEIPADEPIPFPSNI